MIFTTRQARVRVRVRLERAPLPAPPRTPEVPAQDFKGTSKPTGVRNQQTSTPPVEGLSTHSNCHTLGRMADAWATGQKQHSSRALHTDSTTQSAAGIVTSLPANESTLLPDTPGLQIPQLKRSSACLRPDTAKLHELFSVAPRSSTKRKECAASAPCPSGPWPPSPARSHASRPAAGSGRDLSDVVEDVDTDALAEHLYAVIRSAEAALSALGFEADVDSVGGDMDAVELDATDVDRDSHQE